jgi:hypothetical protein
MDQAGHSAGEQKVHYTSHVSKLCRPENILSLYDLQVHNNDNTPIWDIMPQAFYLQGVVSQKT